MGAEPPENASAHARSQRLLEYGEPLDELHARRLLGRDTAHLVMPEWMLRAPCTVHASPRCSAANAFHTAPQLHPRRLRGADAIQHISRRARPSCRPVLVGLAQLTGRNDITVRPVLVALTLCFCASRVEIHLTHQH